MNKKEFEAIVAARVEKSKETLLKKGLDYASEEERLHNFYRAAGMMGQHPITALRGMFAKHIIAFNDIVDAIEKRRTVRRERVDEVLGDSINYLLLADAVLTQEPLVLPEAAASK